MFKFHLLLLLVIGGLCVAESAVTDILEDETPQTPTSDPKLKSFTELTEAETPLSLTEESDIEITTESDNLTTVDARNTTDTSVIIEDPNESLSSAAIFGIIAGVLLGVGILSAIIIIIVKKMSGRYSP
ncbi:podoplanin [Lissotriton helveticus]